MREATIRDVARRAEVSVASVSRALNGLGNVKAETKAKVLAAANALGYVPHAGARSLSLARFHTIGVMLPDLHGEFFSELVRGMDQEASRRGYLLLLSNMHEEGQQATTALRAMRGRVDGLLVMAPHLEPEVLDAALPAALPAVCVNCPRNFGDRPAMRLDNRAGAESVMAHLLGQGYRRIAHIAGPAGNLDARERAEAYADMMRRHAPEVEPLIIAGNFNEESGAAAADAVAKAGMEAVFAANDMMGLGCLNALRQAGVGVPDQVAVAGFDDVPLARYVGLTTVRVRIADMGSRAVARLIDLLEKKEMGEPLELIVPELVARLSTAGGARGAA
jgi:LacI family transcriptional regulator